jgi:AcrR family transcriptional regulator
MMRGTVSRVQPALQEEHREFTRRRILQALVEVLAVDHPASISIPVVAKRAGVSIATLYRYFPTKGALLDAAARYIEEVALAGLGDIRFDISDPDAFLRLAFRRLVEIQPLVHAQHSSPAGRDLRRRRAKRRQAMIAAQLKGLSISGEPRDRLEALIALLMSSSAVLELHDHSRLSVDRAADYVGWAIKTWIAASSPDSPAGPSRGGDSKR